MSSSRTKHSKRKHETTVTINNQALNYQCDTLEIDMNGQLLPAIRFAAVDSPPPPDALYIEAFHEIFTEVNSEEEKSSLLSNINEMLKTTVPAFIDIAIDTKQCIKDTAKYLPPQNHIAALLLKQQINKTELCDFKSQCKEVNAKTVYLGGVYGRNCVTAAACTFAYTIFMRQLGDRDPNVRFQDPHEAHRFANAVIYPPITEGYTSDYGYTFTRYLAFPQTRVFSVPHVDFPGVLEAAEEEICIKNPYDFGASYRNYFNEFDNADNYENLFMCMKEMIEIDKMTHVSLTAQGLLLANLINLIRNYLFKGNWNEAPHFFGATTSLKNKRLKEDATVIAAISGTATSLIK